MISGRLLAILSVAAPLFAQYSGPAILSRGEAPTGMTSLDIKFRPFLEVTGLYDTGLAGVTLDQQGNLASQTSEGIRFGAGISGSHAWKHTQLGIDIRGDINHYQTTTYYDSTDENLMIGLKHQLSRHIFLTLRESAGLFSRNQNQIGQLQTVPFDPSQSFIPTTDFFDNRTFFTSSQADLVIQRSARLSFDLGGGIFLNRRRSTALYGVTGESAHGDVQYRISRRSTIGASYDFSRFRFTKIFSSTDLNGVNLSYSTQLAKSLEFSAYGGFQRLETKFLVNVPIDPVLAFLFGLTQATEISYSTRYIPSFGGRLSKSFRNGVFSVSGGSTVTPGNGLFLTSKSKSASAEYGYTGLRRWSFNASATWNRSISVGNIIGEYGATNGTVSFSRQLAHNLHVVGSFSGRKYQSNSFNNYDRLIYEGMFGLGWTPGDVPLRVW